MTEAIGLQAFRGQTLTSLRRVHFEHAGEVDRTGGPVEFTFGNGETLLFDSGNDGESVKFTLAPWEDPFAGPLSEENERFVQESGKLTAFDVSQVDPFRQLVGRKLFDISPVVHESGKFIGALLNFGGLKILVHVGADELHVAWIPVPESAE